MLIDKGKLKRARLVPPHCFLAVFVAKHVQLDVLDEDAAAGDADEPGWGGGFVGDLSSTVSSMCLPDTPLFFFFDMIANVDVYLPKAVHTGHRRSTPSQTAACRRRPPVRPFSNTSKE